VADRKETNKVLLIGHKIFNIEVRRNQTMNIKECSLYRSRIGCTLLTKPTP
jgi:hypothetical protein